MGVVEFVTDDTLALDGVHALIDALSPGSYMAIACSVPSARMQRAADIWHARGGAPLVLRSPERLARFFDDLELLDPAWSRCPSGGPTR